jgi:hypothetical protein
MALKIENDPSNLDLKDLPKWWRGLGARGKAFSIALVILGAGLVISFENADFSSLYARLRGESAPNQEEVKADIIPVVPVGEERTVSGGIYFFSEIEYEDFSKQELISNTDRISQVQNSDKFYRVPSGTKARVLKMDRIDEFEDSYKIVLLNGPNKGREAWCDSMNLQTDSNSAAEAKNDAEDIRQKAANRRAYAEILRNKFLDNGMDIKVGVKGKESDVLQLTFPLFDDVWVHRFQESDSFVREAIDSFGFKKIVLTNGDDFTQEID